MDNPFLLARFHSVFGNRFWFLLENTDLPEGTETIHVTGSFNYWNPDDAWKLRKEGARKWLLDVPLGRIEAPGNSGYPEYQFVLNGAAVLGANFFPEEPHIGNNFLIVPTEESVAWKKRVEGLTTRKEGQGKEYLANFKPVTGGRLAPDRLYRSSHPFLNALPDDREKGRREAVGALWREHHIRRVINLADGEAVLFDPECTKDYIYAGRDGRVLFIPMDYSTVYYHTRGNLFQSLLGRILEYIALGDGPWVLHCRLGIDRTGVISAFLQALCGVAWENIARDYSDTMSFSPLEYRHPNLLAYSFQRLLGHHPASFKDLQGEVGKALARSVSAKEILIQAVHNLSESA